MKKLGMPSEKVDEGRVGDRLLTKAQAAEEKNLGKIYTVERWIRLGKLPVVRFGPRHVRLRESDIDAFIAAHLQPAREQAR